MSGRQALCKAEDPEDIRAATQAKAEQVAELAEFNENIPLDADERPSKEEEEEMSKAEQEIASLMEQVQGRGRGRDRLARKRSTLHHVTPLAPTLQHSEP